MSTITYHMLGSRPGTGGMFVAPEPFQSVQNPPLPVPPPVSALLPTISIPEVPKPPGPGLLLGTAKVLLQDQLPAALGPVGVAIKAATTADKIVHNIQRALDRGASPTEAHVCETTQVLIEEISGKAMKGAIIAGIPPYLAAATTSPPLAATVPIVASQIPIAYQGAQTTAEILGKGAGALCHKGFAFAKKLAGGK